MSPYSFPQTWNLSPVHDWNSTTINGALQTRTHGPAHEILTMSGAGVSPSPATLEHDTKGNMTTDDRGTNMSWDFDNMLQSFAANGVTGLSNATYEYDAIGRRVAKNVAESAGTQTTVFVQAGQQVTCEYTPSNATTDCDRKYAYGTYIDDVLTFSNSASSSETQYWPIQDRHYSPTTVSSDLGTTIELYTYDFHGNPISHLPAAGGSLIGEYDVRVTGRPCDSHSGLLSFRTRIVRSPLGRFLSRDPIGYAAGNSLVAALFLHDATDPLGLFTISADPGLFPGIIRDFINTLTHDVFPGMVPCDSWECILAAAAAGADNIFLFGEPLTNVETVVREHLEPQTPICDSREQFDMIEELVDARIPIDFRNKWIDNKALSALLGILDSHSLDLILGRARMDCKGRVSAKLDCCECQYDFRLSVDCHVFDTFNFIPDKQSRLYNELALIWLYIQQKAWEKGLPMHDPVVHAFVHVGVQKNGRPRGCQ